MRRKTHARKTFARSILRAAEEAERERIREKVFLSLIAFLLQNHGRGGKAPVEEEAREGEEEE